MNPTARANATAAAALADELARAGVREACISPGSRSTPLVLALAAEQRIRKWVITDERSAGFFALGMARHSGRPVAVACTSGTAAANFSPAVAEAALSAVPLVLLTADRPTELRDCGAPQTIRQAGLFANHARWSADTSVPDSADTLEPYFRTVACRAVAAATDLPPGPVHINIPFREPLLDPAAPQPSPGSGGRDDGRPWTATHPSSGLVAAEVIDRTARLAAGHQRGLIICGPQRAPGSIAVSVAHIARSLGWPILADPLSGVRYGPHDRSAVIDAYDILLRHTDFCAAHRPEIILRLGGLPASKPLHRFLAAGGTAHHLLVSRRHAWPDPFFTATEVIRGDARLFCAGLAQVLGAEARAGGSESNWLASWRHASVAAREATAAALADETEMFAGRVPVEILRHLPGGALLYAGNSMPVRDIDTFTATAALEVQVAANRGANGIDGVLSTALGAAAVNEKPAVLIVGDLSFLHDLGGLQIAARHRLNLLAVVVNDNGGGIFSFLPQAGLGETFEKYFATPHGLDLEPAVRMCGGQFHRAASWESFRTAFTQGLAAGGLNVIEVRTDRSRNAARHAEIIDAALKRLETAAEVAA